ncbi:MAG: hypothetical protein QW561_03050 [Candidatus Aenigmatarchaeota archaeon]
MVISLIRRSNEYALYITHNGEESYFPPHDPSPLKCISDICAYYAKSLQMDMVVFFSPQGYSAPKAGRKLYLHIFSIPIRMFLFRLWAGKPMVRLSHVFSIPLKEGADIAFKALRCSGRGRFVKDDNGNDVMEITGNNIYILFDILQQGESERMILLRKCLNIAISESMEFWEGISFAGSQKFREVFMHLVRETEDQEMDYLENNRMLNLLSYTEMVKKGAEEELKFLEQEMEAIEKTIERYSKRIIQYSRIMADYWRRICVLRNEKDGAFMVNEFNNLFNIPEVKDVYIKDGQILVFTKDIVVEYENRKYRIGSFLIKLSTDGDLMIKNLTNPYRFFDHPHISYGKPCLGSIRAGVSRLIGEYQFMTAIEVLIDYLKTVNPGDWRVSITNWPEVDDAHI